MMPGNFLKFGTRLGRVCVVTALWFHLPSCPPPPQSLRSLNALLYTMHMISFVFKRSNIFYL